MGCIAPPPSIPRCWRIFISGAIPSIAAVRYWIGERGELLEACLLEPGPAGRVVQGLSEELGRFGGCQEYGPCPTPRKTSVHVTSTNFVQFFRMASLRSVLSLACHDA